MPGGISLSELEEDAVKRKVRQENGSPGRAEKRVTATRCRGRNRGGKGGAASPGESSLHHAHGAVCVSSLRVAARSLFPLSLSSSQPLPLNDPDERHGDFFLEDMLDDSLDTQSTADDYDKPAPMVNAILVDDGLGNGGDPVIPYAQTAVAIEDKPWRRRLGVLALMVLVAGITVGIVVPLLTKKNQDDHDDTASTTLAPATSSSLAPTTISTLSLAPTASPTATMAPTTMGLTTVVIKLDDKPQETGWRLDCDGENVANFPVGVYQGRPKRMVTEQFPVVLGGECTFTIFDVDGLGERGYYRMHYGPVYYKSDANLLFEQGSGNFTKEAQVHFDMVPPPTDSPTVSPTQAPSASPAPTTSEMVSIGTPPPSLCDGGVECPDVQVKLVLQLDEFPAETGWTFYCDSVLYGDVQSMTYGEPFERVETTFQVRHGSTCHFVIKDSYGDGMCCQLDSAPGYYQLSINDDMIAEGGEFEAEHEVIFTAIG